MLPQHLVLSTLAFMVATYPLVSWAFGPTRPLGKKTLWLSLAAVLAFLAVKLAWDASLDTTGNYYKILETGRHSSAFDIRKSYKQISRVLHPDKNPSPDAEAQFQRVKVAYDVLMDEKLRDVYNRFGPSALSFDPRHDELRLITDISASYIFWLLVLFVTTIPQGARSSRTWSCILGVALMILHFMFSISETAVPAWLSAVGGTFLIEAELVTLCHRIFPGILVALRCVSESFYVDVDALSVKFLQEMGQQLRGIQGMLVQIKRGEQAAPEAVDQLNTAIETSDKRCIEMIQRLKTAVNDPAANYYWLVLVLMYGLLYLLEGNSGESGEGNKG